MARCVLCGRSFWAIRLPCVSAARRVKCSRCRYTHSLAKKLVERLRRERVRVY